MNNYRWLSLTLLILLLIAGIIGGSYLFVKRNRSEMDKESVLKQIQAYIIEKDHRSAYKLAENLVARYPEDENLQSLKKALSQLTGETSPFDNALSNVDLAEEKPDHFGLESIQPLTPQADQAQEIARSNTGAQDSQEVNLPKGSKIPLLKEEDLTNSVIKAPEKDSEVASDQLKPIETPPRETSLKTPRKEVADSKRSESSLEEFVKPSTGKPSVQVSKSKPNDSVKKPALSTPSAQTPVERETKKETSNKVNQTPSTSNKHRLNEERRIRVQLFEALDCIQTGNLNRARAKVDNLLKEGSIEPDFKKVSQLLLEGKQHEARAELERLLGSGIVFPSIDQGEGQTSLQRAEAGGKGQVTTPKQEGVPSSKKTDSQTSLSEPAQSSQALKEIQNLDLKNPQDRQKAKEQLEKYLKEHPKDSQALGLLASLSEADGESAKAIELYKQAIALSPKAEDYFALGGLYFHQKNYESSAEAYRKSIELDPKNTRSYNNLGVDYVMLNQDDKAIESFKKATVNDPNYANGYYQLGRVYKRNGNLDSALNSFQKAHNLDKKKLTYMAELANTNLEKGNYSAADSLYAQALSQEPNNEALLYNAAQAKNALKEYAKALTLIDKALKSSPSNLSYRLLKAEILDLMGDKVAAEAEYKFVSQVDAKDVLSRANLGNIYTSQKKYAEAKTVLEQAQAIEPNNTTVQNNLGALLIEQGQYAQAISHLKKASEAGVKTADYNLALAYFEEKQDDKAAPILEKLLQEEPHNWNALYLSGLLDYRNNRQEAGRIKLEKILKNNPNYDKKKDIENLVNG